MENPPFNILNEFMNKPNKILSYSVLKNHHHNSLKNFQTNYIDSIMNDNTFISSYTKNYKIKKQSQRIQAVSQIQNWFKKIKCKLDDNKENMDSNNENSENYEKIIEKLIKNQAALKIQKFFIANFKKKKKIIYSNNNNEIRTKILDLLDEIKNEKIEDFSEIDDRIKEKNMTFLFYQNKFLKNQNTIIKTKL